LDESLRQPAPITARDVARILRRRALIVLVTFLLVIVAVGAFTRRQKPLYEANASLLLDTPAAGNGIPGDLMGFIGRAANASLDTEIAKIQSRVFLLDVIKEAGLTTIPEELRGRVLVSQGPGGQILAITAHARTGEEAQRIANAVVETYIAAAKNEFYEKTDLSEERLRTARDDAYRDKLKAEDALHRFTTTVGLSDPSILYTTEARRTVDVRTALAEAQKSLPLQEESLNNLQQQIKSIPPTLVGGYSENKLAVIDSYQNEIANLQTQRKDKLIDFAPDSSEVKEIDTQITNRQQALHQLESGNNAYSKGSLSISRNGDYAKVQSAIYDTQLGIKNLSQNIAAWRTQLNALEAEQKKMAPQELTYEGLKRARDDANDSYEKTNLGLLQMRQSRVTSVPYVHVLDDAQLPPEPISPKPLLNMIMAVFLGLLLGIGAALVTEYFAGGFTDPMIDHLPEVGGVPLLGSLPTALPSPSALGAAGRDLPVLQTVARQTAATEDILREIGYVLLHRGADERAPVVLLTSVRSDDSTAALAAQLTATLVRDGMRVTLVDADRRQPRLNRVFGAPDAPGLADILAGRSTVKDALHIGGNGRLRFLAAGSPDDESVPAEERLRAVFKELAAPQDTDVVFVSGPAVWNARLIAPLENAARGMVLLTYADAGSPDESVARVRRLLTNGYKPEIVGVVVSQAGVTASGDSAVAENELFEEALA
jgi:uncharacterized protein involved in exopolysaccharide biosynthesis/Mrp family chromosome partitioning ATPase